MRFGDSADGKISAHGPCHLGARRGCQGPQLRDDGKPSSSDVAQHLSAWHMPEMVDLLEKVPTWRTANYNTCAYEDDIP